MVVRLVVAGVLLASIFATVSPSPAAAAAEPALYEARPTNAWGVDGLDPGSGNFRYYSPVFAFTQIGDSVYSGGKFLQVTDGATSVDQPYLAAFSSSGDQWRSGFTPDLDWSVFALERNADGSRLFVGGEFPSVDGDTSRAAFAALDPVTGALDPTFDVRVSRTGANAPRIHALHVEGEWLYLAGAFSRISGPDGVLHWKNNVARVNVETGAVDPTWRPRAQGGAVWEVVADPVRDRVLLGGLFRTIDGNPSAAFAIVDDSTGTIDPDYDHGFGLTYFDQRNTNYDFVLEIEVEGDRIALGGQQHRLVVTDADLGVLSVHQTNRYQAYNGGRGGDIQDIVISDGVVYAGCHCFGQVWRDGTNDYYDVRAVFAVDLETGDYLEWFQPDFSGNSGGWAFLVDDQGCLWVGSDSTQAGQTPGRGVARLCHGPNLSWDGGTTVTASAPVAARPAGAARDGDLVTNVGAAHTGAGTGPSEQPYFDIELATQAEVDDVILWAATNQQQAGFRDLTVWASDRPFTTTDMTALRQDPNVVEVARPGDHRGKRTMTFPVDGTVRHIRVQADYTVSGIGPTELVLSEIAVIGELTGVETPVDAPPEQCAVSVDGTTAEVTWTGAGSNDQIVYRSVDGSPDYWRGRVAGVDQFTDELRVGSNHTYSVSTVGAPAGQRTVCTPDPVVADDPGPEPVVLTSTYQNRSRIVLHWDPSVAITIERDGVEVGADDDGWFTDTGLTAGTTYLYAVTTAEGAVTTLEVSTLP